MTAHSTQFGTQPDNTQRPPPASGVIGGAQPQATARLPACLASPPAGAEILQCTFDVAEVLVKMLKEDILPSLRPDENVRVGVFHDSIFNRPELVREADVAYANCVTWPNDTMTQLAAIAEGGRGGGGGGGANFHFSLVIRSLVLLSWLSLALALCRARPRSCRRPHRHEARLAVHHLLGPALVPRLRPHRAALRAVRLGGRHRLHPGAHALR